MNDGHVYWLIEKTEDGEHYYWTGWDWQEDVNLACKYANKGQADCAKNCHHFMTTGRVFVADHVWHCGAPEYRELYEAAESRLAQYEATERGMNIEAALPNKEKTE